MILSVHSSIKLVQCWHHHHHLPTDNDTLTKLKLGNINVVIIVISSGFSCFRQTWKSIRKTRMQLLTIILLGPRSTYELWVPFLQKKCTNSYKAKSSKILFFNINFEEITIIWAIYRVIYSSMSRLFSLIF